MVINQAYLFLIFTSNGVFIGLLFDFFRILRKSFKTINIITYIILFKSQKGCKILKKYYKNYKKLASAILQRLIIIEFENYAKISSASFSISL